MTSVRPGSRRVATELLSPARRTHQKPRQASRYRITSNHPNNVLPAKWEKPQDSPFQPAIQHGEAPNQGECSMWTCVARCKSQAQFPTPQRDVATDRSDRYRMTRVTRPGSPGASSPWRGTFRSSCRPMSVAPWRFEGGDARLNGASERFFVPMVRSLRFHTEGGVVVDRRGRRSVTPTVMVSVLSRAGHQPGGRRPSNRRMRPVWVEVFGLDWIGLDRLFSVIRCHQGGVVSLLHRA